MRIPLIAYPVAFAGALVAGRAISGGSGPASDATAATTTPTATTADDGWTGFDGSGTQLGGDGTGGVLQSPITPAPTPTPATTPVVTDINGAAPDRIGVRPAGATGWVVVSGSAPFYTKVSSTKWQRKYGTVSFSAWCGTPTAVYGTWGTTANRIVKILSGAHAGQFLGINTAAVNYTRG